MVFYIFFLPINIPHSREILSITLNMILLRKILLRSSIKSIVTLGTIFEIMSSGVVGCFILQYFVTRKIINYANEKLTSISIFELIVITFLAISSSICLELLIKIYLDFDINSTYYVVIAIGSIISVTFIQYLLKPSLTCKSSLYRH